VRFRRARGVERQQIKRLAFSGLVFCAILASGPFLWALPESLATAWVWPVLFLTGASTVPAAVGVAILRHRLYDIDLLINRALVYGSLAVTLVLTYLGSVVALQHGFRATSGGTSQLAVAGLNPRHSRAVQPAAPSSAGLGRSPLLPAQGRRR
jgi:hypothetical protein